MSTNRLSLMEYLNKLSLVINTVHTELGYQSLLYVHVWPIVHTDDKNDSCPTWSHVFSFQTNSLFNGFATKIPIFNGILSKSFIHINPSAL